jgi:hypothetical protein
MSSVDQIRLYEGDYEVFFLSWSNRRIRIPLVSLKMCKKLIIYLSVYLRIWFSIPSSNSIRQVWRFSCTLLCSGHIERPFWSYKYFRFLINFTPWEQFFLTCHFENVHRGQLEEVDRLLLKISTMMIVWLFSGDDRFDVSLAFQLEFKIKHVIKIGIIKIEKKESRIVKIRRITERSKSIISMVQLHLLILALCPRVLIT